MEVNAVVPGIVHDLLQLARIRPRALRVEKGIEQSVGVFHVGHAELHLLVQFTLFVQEPNSFANSLQFHTAESAISLIVVLTHSILELPRPNLLKY